MKADRSEVAPEARVVDHNPLECNELASEGCAKDEEASRIDEPEDSL